MAGWGEHQTERGAEVDGAQKLSAKYKVLAYEVGEVGSEVLAD